LIEVKKEMKELSEKNEQQKTTINELKKQVAVYKDVV
jgi:hypothetical protein